MALTFDILTSIRDIFVPISVIRELLVLYVGRGRRRDRQTDRQTWGNM